MRQALPLMASTLAVPCARDPLAPSPPLGLCGHVPVPESPLPSPTSFSSVALTACPHAMPPASSLQSLRMATVGGRCGRFWLDRKNWGSRSGRRLGDPLLAPVGLCCHLCAQTCCRGCGCEREVLGGGQLSPPPVPRPPAAARLLWSLTGMGTAPRLHFGGRVTKARASGPNPCVSPGGKWWGGHRGHLHWP